MIGFPAVNGAVLGVSNNVAEETSDVAAYILTAGGSVPGGRLLPVRTAKKKTPPLFSLTTSTDQTGPPSLLSSLFSPLSMYFMDQTANVLIDSPATEDGLSVDRYLLVSLGAEVLTHACQQWRSLHARTAGK